MTQIAKKYSIKCSVDGCDGMYNSRGLCRKHYRQLLGKEGGYIRDYQKDKLNPARMKMKRESEKRYYQRMKDAGKMSKIMHERYLKYISNPENLKKKREGNSTYYKENKGIVQKRNSAHARRLRDHYKEIVFNHYTKNNPKCANCGIDVYSVLSLDHIKNNGSEHRRKIRNGGHAGSTTIYREIINKKFPKEYQVLCFNCNYHKEFMRRCDEQDKKIEGLLC